MALTTGTKLGPYELSDVIGAGGMGEVYRARDPRLRREVAIKILPASFSSDPERLQRFEQESQAAAALNHPNILAVHDVGTQDRCPYIVSELLKGETLRELLKSGALPVRKAIDYAIQIAHGLAAAHEAGIVHRDLKPENILITDDGRVKLLDFGLAKLTHPDSGLNGQSMTRTAASEPGTVLGTVGYMSPEQVRAKAVDARSDLFSFGAILYEMLSGKRAFHADSAAETMTAILKEEPPDVTETNHNVSPALERIIRHCLEKNPALRFQSAHDLAFHLEALTGSSKLTSDIQRAVQISSAQNPTWLFAAGVAVLTLATLGGGYFWGRSATTSSKPEFHQITFRRGTVDRARFAGDGNEILYSASWEGNPVTLFITRYGGVESRMVETETMVVAVSSNQLAVLLKPSVRSWGSYPRAAGTLAVLPIEGGTPRPLLDRVEGADWTPDGAELAVIRDAQEFSIVTRSNTLEFPADNTIYTPQSGWLSHVRFSPDGKYLAFEQHVPGGDDGELLIVDRTGKKIAESPHYPSINGLAWRSNGEVWFTATSGADNRSVRAMNLEGKIRDVYRAPSNLALHDIAANGRVLLSDDNDRQLMMGGVTGAPDKDISWLDWSIAKDISNDGSSAIFSESGTGVQGVASTFMRKLDGETAVRLGEGTPSRLSPDGNWVTTLDNNNQPHIVLLPTGVGKPRQLTPDGWDFSTSNIYWMPDSKSVLFSGRQAGQKPRVYRVNIATREIKPMVPEGVIDGMPSPDGKFLIGREDSMCRVYTIDGAVVRTLPLLTRDEYIDRWTTDGKSVLVWDLRSSPKLDRMDVVTGKRVPLTEIKPLDLTGVIHLAHACSTPDGHTHLYSAHRELSDLFVVNGLK